MFKEYDMWTPINWCSLTVSDALLVAVFTGCSFTQSDILWQLKLTTALVNALVISRIDYRNAVLTGVQYMIFICGNSKEFSMPQQDWYKKYDSITSTLCDVLHWLPIWQRVDYKLGVLMFNCRHNLAPGYLTTMYHAVSENPGHHNLRSAARWDLMVPPTRTVRYSPRSFAAAGPSIWNSLPTSLRNQQLSAISFRWHLKTELYCRAYNRPLAHSWLFMTVRVGEHNCNITYL